MDDPVCPDSPLASDAAAQTLALYDQAPCGLLSFDTDLRLVRVNGTLLRWLGYEAPELVQTCLLDHVDAAGHPALQLHA